jgi:16S rRNA (guanine1516-N2)-methyltransferase
VAVQLPAVVAPPENTPDAHALAERLGTHVVAHAAYLRGEGGPLVVWCDGDGLALRIRTGARVRPLRPPVPLRRPGSDPLLRAFRRMESVVDATAGWAEDAGVLAAAGHNVTLIERSPILHAILEDALQRWRERGIEAATRMTLMFGDARDLLPNLRADAVYLDPMYPDPKRARSARTAVALHALRLLLGDDPDQHGLLQVAQRAARQRVVVKRPIRALPFAGVTASGSLLGRTVRYDFYPGLEDPS